MLQTFSHALAHQSGQTSGDIPVYFERFSPVGITSKPPVVMIHGGAHSGACYQRTVRGRPGWAYDFVAGGYPVVVPDWPGIGRSGHVPFDRLTGEVVVEGLDRLIKSLDEPVVLMVHSMAGCYGWRLAELNPGLVRGVIGVTPSPPGNIQPETPVVARTETSVEIETFGRRMTIDLTRLNFPAAETVATKYVGDSRFFPRELLGEYRASLLGLPPRILMQRRNIEGSQLRVADPTKLAGQPVLVITGTADLDHPREVDEAIVTWLNMHGAKAEFCYLGDLGVVGNGHMLMIEDNSSAIARLMLDWLDAQPLDRE